MKINLFSSCCFLHINLNQLGNVRNYFIQNTFFSARVYHEMFLFHNEKCCPSVTDISAKLLVIHETNFAICLLTHFPSLILYSLWSFYVCAFVCMYVSMYAFTDSHTHTLTHSILHD